MFTHIMLLKMINYFMSLFQSMLLINFIFLFILIPYCIAYGLIIT